MDPCPVCAATLTSDPRLLELTHAALSFCSSCLTVVKRVFQRDANETADSRLVAEVAGPVVRRTLERLDAAERDGTITSELAALRADAAARLPLAVTLVATRIASLLRGPLRLRYDLALSISWTEPTHIHPMNVLPPGLGAPPVLEWRFRDIEPIASRAYTLPMEPHDRIRTGDFSGELLIPKPSDWFAQPAILTSGTRVEPLRADGPSVLLTSPELFMRSHWFPVRAIRADIDLLEPI